VLIRVADDEDWPQVWPFFSRIVAEGTTYAYPDDLTLETARSWWMEPPPGRTVVAVAEDADGGDGSPEGTVIGSAKMGPNRPGRGAHVATASFMVDPAHHGRGVGRALATYVLEWARSAGYQAMQFNAVVETNASAVALWRSVGFEVLTTVPEAFDHATDGLVGLHVMYQKL
jgi:GNAT superfamily N-acetyltransferase